MTWLPTARLATFGTVSLFALIVLGLSADVIAVTAPFDFGFSRYALATSIITLITVIPIFVIDIVRQGAIFSYIVVESGVLSFLWILWLSSGSYAAWTSDNLFFSCGAIDEFDDSFVTGNNVASRGCQEMKAIAAFSFLTWIVLSAYVGTINYLAVRAQQRGLNVWSMSVREEAVLYPEAKSGGISAQMPTMPASLPASQTYPQQAYPQQAYPQQAYPQQAYPPAPAPGPAPGAIQV